MVRFFLLKVNFLYLGKIINLSLPNLVKINKVFVISNWHFIFVLNDVTMIRFLFSAGGKLCRNLICFLYPKSPSTMVVQMKNDIGSVYSFFIRTKKTTKDEWLSYFDQTDLYLGESESNWSSKHQGKIKRYTLWSIEQFSVVIHIIALNQWKKLWLSIAKFSNQIQASAPYFCNLDSYRLGDTYYVWIWDSSIVPQETKETF